ncbi:MAG: carboxypeptidase-like regulatory domain-containing protein [Bacteroidales bacterium]|nr:carboxypeptidase-like regulatory domain-containing protein [Bacteroidales bacterium]
MKRLLAISILLLACWGALGQTRDFLTLSGKVTDSQTGEALAFVSVNLKGTNISIVTNSEGVFSLKVPETTGADARVSISSIGYLTAEYAVNDFLQLPEDRMLSVHLLPVVMRLDPAVVRSVDPKVLFSTAYARVRWNYPSKAVGMTAFYREMIRKGTAKYLVLNEAVVDIEKASYSGYANDKAAIYKGRGSINYDVTDTLFVQFQGGITAALDLDMVKSPFVGTTLQAATHFYDFSLDGIETLDGKTCYVVGFRPKEGAQPFLFIGKMFIETESFAIARMEFSMDLKGREEAAAGEFIIRRPADRRFTVEHADYSVNFKEYDGLWYFEYSRVDINFTARKRRSLFRTSYTVTGEMAVTDHKKGEFKVESDERVRMRDILSNRVAAFTDEDFWEGYNVIEPDQSIDQAIRRIIRQLRRREEN